MAFIDNFSAVGRIDRSQKQRGERHGKKSQKKRTEQAVAREKGEAGEKRDQRWNLRGHLPVLLRTQDKGGIISRLLYSGED